MVTSPDCNERAVLTVLMSPSCRLAPESVTLRPGAISVVSRSLIIMSPTPSLSASALKTTSPVPGANARTRSFSGATVILLLASSVTFVAPDSPASVPSDIVSSPPLSFSEPSVSKPPVSKPSVSKPSVSAIWPSKMCSSSAADLPLIMLIFSGSISSIPVSPLGARVLTAPSKVRFLFPETSTKPPFPEIVPPVALISPKYCAVSSAHTTTRPPSPLLMASAAMLVPAFTRVLSAANSVSCPL